MADAVHSVLADIGTHDELVVVDDGSTDGSDDLLRSMPGQIRVVANEGRGIVDALNTGLRLATGEFIARCDADDQWLPGHTELLVAELESDPEAVAVFGAAQLRGSKGDVVAHSVPPGSPTELRRAMLRGNPLIHGAVMARRGSIISVGGYRSVSGAEDFDLWTRLAESGRLGTIPDLIYDYQLSSASAHTTKRRRQARSTLRVLLQHALRTRELSVAGLARNALSAVWPVRRFWYRA
ncbi:glycosyltransferase [Aeromicrobium sp. CFBP 8757]|nr:glycosyltransferase [Aeromicrobium sp. CFBP 8757]